MHAAENNFNMRACRLNLESAKLHNFPADKSDHVLVSSDTCNKRVK